ncbi:hypothetical protein [Marinobacterium jannaschii]|uniref:hypothetical protein n=1 Tax=Marinobacterium jannaschii TaxID=64970 RepID=UPI0004816CF0|nr:hypothetical protein [Marinobacterium jannaschii]
MKPCKQPKHIKIGLVFYSVDAYFDPEKNSTTTEVSEWYVRSIRALRGTISRHGIKFRGGFQPRKYVNLTRKNAYTWVKKSRQHGDFGWASSISKYDRQQFRLGDEHLPFGLYTTKLQAAKHERSALKNLLQDSEKWIANNPDADQVLIAEEKREVHGLQKSLAAIERRIKKLSH